MSSCLNVAGRTDVGLTRQQNEDAFTIVDLTEPSRTWSGEVDVTGHRILLAVSDGMGGHQAGEVASAMVIATVVKSLVANAAETPDHALELAVRDANQAVRTAAEAQDKKGMGATLTAIMIDGQDAWIAEVGDSRAYLIRCGEITRLTKDQSYVQLLVDGGVMTEAEAVHSPFSNVILQAMGHQANVSVALGRLELRGRDCLLLCSDGLTKHVGDDEMKTILLAAPDLRTACDRLVDLANERGGSDNITVVLAGIGGTLALATPGETPGATFEVLKSFEQ